MYSTSLSLTYTGSYIQYRPVSYTHPERDVSTSTELHITAPNNLDNPAYQLNSSLAWAFYGYQLDKILVQGFNVSFGQSDDGYYAHTNYNTWYVCVFVLVSLYLYVYLQNMLYSLRIYICLSNQLKDSYAYIQIPSLCIFGFNSHSY